MAKLVLLGLAAAFFFSSTFVLNRAMQAGGGHWFWTASLRYGFMFGYLTLLIFVKDGRQALVGTVATYRRHWRFCTLAGGVGFGVFYSMLCFASSFAPGWVVATTWQLTILATPIVLLAFGRRVPMRGIALLITVFLGIVVVNLSQPTAETPRATLFLGMGAVLVAAFAYPFGNTLVGEAKVGSHPRIPHITGASIESAFGRVLLMVIGSIPFWIVVGLVLALGGHLPAPTTRQWFSTAFVALSTGVIATSIFFTARHQARTAYEISAVDATQAGEVPFALLVEMALFHAAAPAPVAQVGIVLIVGGIAMYAVRSHTQA